MNGVPITTAEDIRSELVSQLTGSVRWTSSMQYALSQGVTHFIEVGPDEVLTTVMKRIDRKAKRLAVNGPESLGKFAAMINDTTSD